MGAEWPYLGETDVEGLVGGGGGGGGGFSVDKGRKERGKGLFNRLITCLVDLNIF